MSQLILRTMVATGIFLGAATASFAAPVPLPLALNAASQAGNVQTVYYMYNHHRYYHRHWDAAHKRWHYY
jgi:hypothetical protein